MKGDVNDTLRTEGIDAVRARHDMARSYESNGRGNAAAALASVHAAFHKWFGPVYDLDTINAVLATAAAERLNGDPLWLLVVSGPGNAKTETVQSLSGAGAHVTSTITSEGALLSATPPKKRSSQATGGLLRKLGERGLLVIKDVTSILSANHNVRAGVLAALREVHDGRWERNVGMDGGQTLTWAGRLGLIGAVTTAWDTAHTVISMMGDRFVLFRANSHVGRVAAGTQAIRNTGVEVQMRAELADTVAGVISHVGPSSACNLSENDVEQLLRAANIVTLARTAVERDYRGEVIDAHDPEMPTRFAKQLTQMLRGAVAIGIAKPEAMRLTLRCARDSIPPLRLKILLDISEHPDSLPRAVCRRTDKPRSTVRRELQALHMLRLLRCDEEDRGEGRDEWTVWRYSPHPDLDTATLQALAGLSKKVSK